MNLLPVCTVPNAHTDHDIFRQQQICKTFRTEAAFRFPQTFLEIQLTFSIFLNYTTTTCSAHTTTTTTTHKHCFLNRLQLLKTMNDFIIAHYKGNYEYERYCLVLDLRSLRVNFIVPNKNKAHFRWHCREVTRQTY